MFAIFALLPHAWLPSALPEWWRAAAVQYVIGLFLALHMATWELGTMRQ
jgi:hypothetical protein